MAERRRASERKDKHGPVLPEGEGESAQRRQRLKEHGGLPLTIQLEDGQLRGVDEEGRPTTGTHGGPKKEEGPAREPDYPKR